MRKGHGGLEDKIDMKIIFYFFKCQHYKNNNNESVFSLYNKYSKMYIFFQATTITKGNLNDEINVYIFGQTLLHL